MSLPGNQAPKCIIVWGKTKTGEFINKNLYKVHTSIIEMFLKGDYRAQILSPLMRVKASFEVGLKSTQGKGLPKAHAL
jgi:hypothetical protein